MWVLLQNALLLYCMLYTIAQVAAPLLSRVTWALLKLLVCSGCVLLHVTWRSCFVVLHTMTVKVSRIFAVNLLLAALSGCEWNREDVVAMTVYNLYVVTSDADLWPISSSAYDLADGVDVLSLNAFCCGTFKHRDNVYQMIPMANVGARAHTWRNITHRSFCAMGVKILLALQ